MKKVFTFGLCLSLLVYQAGCAPVAIPLSPEDRVKFKSIDITSARFAPEAHFDLPAAGALAGAGRESAIGALRSLQYGAKAAGGVIRFFPVHKGEEIAGAFVGLLATVCLALGVAFAPPAALVTAIEGAVAAEPAEIVQEADVALRNVLTEAKVQEILRDHVMEAAREDIGYSLTVLKDYGPSRAGDLVDYRSVVESGVQAVLEIDLMEVQLSGKWLANPPLKLRMNARARLIRASDNKVFYDHDFEYVGYEHLFSEWAANEAELLREEFEICYGLLARQIVDAVFTKYLLAG